MLLGILYPLVGCACGYNVNCPRKKEERPNPWSCDCVLEPYRDPVCTLCPGSIYPCSSTASPVRCWHTPPHIQKSGLVVEKLKRGELSNSPETLRGMTMNPRSPPLQRLQGFSAPTWFQPIGWSFEYFEPSVEVVKQIEIWLGPKLALNFKCFIAADHGHTLCAIRAFRSCKAPALGAWASVTGCPEFSARKIAPME